MLFHTFVWLMCAWVHLCLQGGGVSMHPPHTHTPWCVFVVAHLAAL